MPQGQSKGIHTSVRHVQSNANLSKESKDVKMEGRCFFLFREVESGIRELSCFKSWEICGFQFQENKQLHQKAYDVMCHFGGVYHEIWDAFAVIVVKDMLSCPPSNITK